MTTMNSIRLTKTAVERLAALRGPARTAKHRKAGIGTVTPESAFISRLLAEPSTRKDGSITVELNDEDTLTLLTVAMRWEASAREAFETDPAALSDIRSATGLVSQIEKYTQ
jgi:hypothetical protein